MITCNRCGNVNPAFAGMCQNCGTPLASSVESESSQKREGRGQELPSWLESLRISDPPAPSINNPPNFHAADLIDGGSLPSWMRPQRDAVDNPPSGSYPALRASSVSAPNTDDNMLPAKGISARSLIDEQSLPQWLQPEKQATAPQKGINASSLVQPDAMPEWMKTMQPQTPMTSQPAAPAPETAAPSSGFSARELIDQSSLPTWMSQQGGREAANPASSGQGGASGQGFPASSLLDKNALPVWLRDIDKGQQGGSKLQQNVAFPPPQPNQPWQAPPLQQGVPSPAQYNQPWQGPPPPMQTAPHSPTMTNMPAESLSAGSLIDKNSLPAWLREGAEQRLAGPPAPQQAPPGPGYQGSQKTGYGIPSRTESMRVPNRPRTEVGANNDSEAAANVFASMLGVASAAPHFPASAPGPQGPQMPQTSYAPTQQSPQMGPAQPGQPGFQPSQPLQPAYAYNSGYPAGPQGPMVGPIPNNSFVGVPMQGGIAQQKPAAKKRGFFEFFRSWFSRP